MTYGNLGTTMPTPWAETSCVPSLASFQGTKTMESYTKVCCTFLSTFFTYRPMFCSATAPHPVARRLVISARPSLPTPPASSPESSPVVHQNPPRPRHPAELLTHRFVPIGSLADENKDVDMDASPADPKPAPHESRKEAEQGEKSKKKRKVEVESPKKKTKKAKTAS